MVIAPASTGSDSNNKTAVIITDQQNRGKLYIAKPIPRVLRIVAIKLIAPSILDAPAKCRLKIPKSTAGPECASILESGGYTVHPVPTPTSKKLETSSNAKDGGKSQKLRLFRRGKDISGAPTKIGTNQLPKPPITTGITMKKIIMNA